MKKRVVKEKQKKNRSTIDKLAFGVSIIAVIALIGICIGLGGLIYFLQGKPTLYLSDFETQESSIIYDQNGEVIAELGLTIRQNISYDDLPNSVVDAFVAVEDSRYFEHNGFDVPRFTKAILENIRSMSFSQGGSTFTMQLVKNTYFTDDDTGEEAARNGSSGVQRKVQEIALALDLENNISKKVIFEQYVNKLNFGGDRNIRGIEKASEYYFNKPISEVNYVEAAMLAGVINAPNYYNPFYNIEAANSRKDDVIYLMHKHGYISDEQYELGLSIRVEDLLSDPNSNAVSSDSNAIPYQAYIDAVCDEVYDLTGSDPYSTTMHIYTYMNKDVQEVMDKIEIGGYPDVFEFPDEYFEAASICVNNQTGAIIGILGGRNYSTGGQLLLNHATDQSRQTGSSIKPILDYSLAFENLGWATSHVITDKPLFYEGTEIMISNSSNTYKGDVTLYDALGESINTCAIQTLQAVIDEKGEAYCVDYLQSLDYDTTMDTFDIQNAIGGFNMTASVKQMAGAYAMIMNKGNYNEPHCIKKIEFTNGKSPITVSTNPKQVLSEAAAFMTTELLYSNVNNTKYGGSYSVVRDDYPVYAKTGTTTWEDEGEYYGIPFGSRKDSWLCASSSAYTVSTWTGYDKAQQGKQSYITEDVFYQRIQAKITNLILDASAEYCDETPAKVEKPASGITQIKHIIGTWPYASVIENMDPQYITTGYIKSDKAKLVTLTAKVEDMSDNYSIDYNESNGKLYIKWPEYPDKSAVDEKHQKDISLKKKDGSYAYKGSGTQMFNIAWVYGDVVYKAEITATQDGKKVYSEEIKSKDKETEVRLDLPGGDNTLEVSIYYGFSDAPLNSNNKKWSKKVTVENLLNIPSFDDLDDLLDWFNRNGLSVNSTYELESEDSSSYYEIYNHSTNKKVSGSLNAAEKTSYDIYYYEGKVNIELNVSKRNNTITVTSNVNCTFEVSNNASQYAKKNGKTLTITLPNDYDGGDIEVTATYNKQTVTETIKID